METINVEEIMEQIRNDIKEKGYTSDMLSFQEVACSEMTGFYYNENEYQSIVNDLNRCSYVPWYRDLKQTGIRAIVKKAIRKLATFLIAPISDEQNYFNSKVTMGFNQMVGYIKEQQDVIETYQKNIELLEEKVERLEQELRTVTGK